MSNARIPTIAISQSEYDKFKLLTKRSGLTMSKAIRNFVIEFNKKMLNNNGSKEPYDFMSKYTIKDKKPPINSTNYKSFIYK